MVSQGFPSPYGDLNQSKMFLLAWLAYNLALPHHFGACQFYIIMYAVIATRVPKSTWLSGLYYDFSVWCPTLLLSADVGLPIYMGML